MYRSGSYATDVEGGDGRTGEELLLMHTEKWEGEDIRQRGGNKGMRMECTEK